MKSILIILLALTFQSNAFASMSTDEQADYVKKEAKEIRRGYWINGYDDVSSTEVAVTKAQLDEHVKSENNSYYEMPLDSEEIADLYRCFYRKSCSLHLVTVSSDYMSGYGVEAHFILLDVEKKKHDTIMHAIYHE